MKLLTDAEIENIKKLAYDNALADLRNATYTNDTETLRATCRIGFDFSIPEMVIFSIERVDVGNAAEERTVISAYFAGDAETEPTPKIEEFSFLCSRGQHDALVKAFAEAKHVAATTDAKQLLKG